MTKLMEWLVTAGVLVSVWWALITNKVDNQFTRENYTLILYSPIIFVFLFGLYAATVVLYRTFTFNNCEKAAEELKQEIEMAKKDLKEKGYSF